MPSIATLYICVVIFFTVFHVIFHSPLLIKLDFLNLNYWITSFVNGILNSVLFIIAFLIAKRYSRGLAWRAFWLANAGLIVEEILFHSSIEFVFHNPNTVIKTTIPFWNVLLINDLGYLLFSSLAFLVAVNIELNIQAFRLYIVKRKLDL